MKFVLAFYGTRGDVEPGIAVGRELMRRGHDVHMAVPPDLIGSVESVGLAAVAYGPDTQAWLEDTRDFWGYFFRNFWRVRDVQKYLRESREPGIRAWAEMSTTLTSVADGADLLVTGVSYEELAVRRLGILRYSVGHGAVVSDAGQRPARAESACAGDPLGDEGVRVADLAWGEEGRWCARGVNWAYRRRRAPCRVGSPNANCWRSRPMTRCCFPGLATEWAEWDGQRPFVGTLTLELATEADEDVMSWIAAGTPPICFGFGSIPVESPADMIAMIAGACAQVGERALVCAGWTDFSNVPQFDHVKVVGAVNYATIFPSCRAVVHHGGAGTTAAGLRAGVPTLILWMADVQVIWGAAVKGLKVGTSRRFSAATEKTLVADLRTILAPQYLARARRDRDPDDQTRRKRRDRCRSAGRFRPSQAGLADA